MSDSAPRWSDPGEANRSRVRILADVGRALVSLVIVSIALSVGVAVAGLTITRWWVLVSSVAVAALVLELATGSLLRGLAARGSVVTALVLGTTAQLAVLGTALALSTDLARLPFTTIVLVLVVAAAVLSAGRWVVGASDSAYIVAAAGRHGARTRARSRHEGGPGGGRRPRGLLVVQLDGVSLPTLHRAIEGGQAPAIARWVGTTHVLRGWWATVPSTTPATMAGVLHGDADTVPAFRWWDRRAGRLLAASNPRDALLIESRFASGSELLSGGGTAISTTFTGGATQAYLTISNATRLRGLGSGSAFLGFFSRPLLLPGALVLTVGEVVKELYQARRQRVRGVRPRIPRRGTYVVLRGLTNVLVRKLNLSLIAEAMGLGRPVIFVDFVDYDEIAHHAGPERPESLRAVEGLDAVLGALQALARSCATDYELVVLSDHGQSLGSTFAQLNGQGFSERVHELMGLAPADEDAGDIGTGEDWAPMNALLASVLERWTTESPPVVLGPDQGRNPADRRPRGRGLEPHTDRPPEDLADLPEVVVTGGGNLGMVWFPRRADRPTLGEIDRTWPDLVPGLLATPGVGLVLAADEDGVPLVIGPTGARRLDGSATVVSGSDPVAGFPQRAAADLARLSAVRDAGDLVVISTVNGRGHVHAFEEQVGSHGGLGGPQNHAILLHPRDWALDASSTSTVPELGESPVLVGPVALHHQLRRWRDAWVGGEGVAP